MMHTVLQSYTLTNQDYSLYVVHSYNHADITNLIPESKIELVVDDKLREYYNTSKEACTNFSVLADGSLKLPEGLPNSVMPDNMVPEPELNLDDVWNFLYRLQQVDGFLLVTNSGYTRDEFQDDEACYLVPTKRMTYSTSHANCTLHYLANGTITNPETDEVYSSKRWTSYKIVMNNELTRRYITLLLDDAGLEKLTANSNIAVKSFKLSEAYNLPMDELDDLDTSAGINYCTVDLQSIPLVNVNFGLVSNYHLLYSTVQMSNINTVQTKVFDALIQELVAIHPTLNTFMSGDDVYKKRAIVDEDHSKHNGVKFTLSGQSSVPSVNSCIKALKNPEFTSVGDFLGATVEQLDSLEDDLYHLNILQRNAIGTLIHLSKEYIETKNPDTCYNSVDNLYKMYLQQRELCKLRLTYIRSMFMLNLHPDMYKLKKLFSSDVNGTTVFINLGEF